MQPKGPLSLIKFLFFTTEVTGIAAKQKLHVMFTSGKKLHVKA